MAQKQSTALKVDRREPVGLAQARRLRREGQIPGVVYGGGEDPVSLPGRGARRCATRSRTPAP